MSTLMARLNRGGLVGLVLGLGMTLAACGGAPRVTATLTRLPATTPNGAISVTPRPSATHTPLASQTPVLTATPVRVRTARVASPDGNYYIEVSALGAALYHTGDNQPLSEVAGHYELEFPGPAVFWSPNSHLTITSPDKVHVYLWSTNGTPPLNLDLGQANHSWFVWAPDSTYLAMTEKDDTQQNMVFVIVQPDGRITRLEGGGVRVGEEVNNIGWFDSSIFEVSASDGLCCVRYIYFDVHRNAEIWHWIDGYQLSQGPAYSPNGAWQITDSSSRGWEAELLASRKPLEHSYEVHQWATATTYTLYSGAEQYVEWVGWTADSATFYLISRPTNAEAIAADSLPFGLLALDPATRETRMIFEQAVFAALSDDEGLACVAFPARRADGGLGLEVGVFDLAAGTLAGRTSLADEISYPWPASHGGGPNEWAAGALAACGW